jgi:hypothetical protein
MKMHSFLNCLESNMTTHAQRTRIRGAWGVSILFAAALMALEALPARAATRTWVGGSATWDDANTASWSGGAAPVNGDIANITINAAANLNVGFAATGLSGLGTLTLNNPGAGTNTLFLDGSDSLTVTNLNLNARGRIDMSGGTLAIPASSIFYLNGGTFFQGGGLLDVNTSSGTGPYFLSAGSTWTITGGTAKTRSLTTGPGTVNIEGGVVNDYATTAINNSSGNFNQTGGCFTQNVNYMNISAGALNLGGGTNAAKQILMTGVATISQTGGVLTASVGGLEMRTIGSTFNLSGGTATFPVTYAGYSAAGGAFINLTGGSLSAGTLFVAWGDATSNCYFRLRGGALTAGNTIVYPRGTFEGYGPVTFTGYMQNNGWVIADGRGTSTNLDLTSASSIQNATDNTTNRGWFAVNKGRLMLKPIAITAGASTNNWGEAVADTTIDLVNSARIALTGATAGSLTGALFSVDRADVPAGLFNPIGVWSFGGVTCTTSAITFRYDHMAVVALDIPESDLRVWRYNGSQWVDVTGSWDSTAKTLTSASGGSLATTTFFAVATPQPPSKPPVIQNRPVSNMATNGATFNARLVTNGTFVATVYVLWGENNGSVSGSWGNTNQWSAGAWANGSFPNTNISLTPDRTYYYTFGAFDEATNALATTEESRLVVAPPKSLITGELNVQAADPTGRVNSVDSIVFAVTRPATCTHEDLIVNYTLGGTATNGTDYTIAPVSGVVVIAQGQASGTVVVTSPYKIDGEKSVILTLTPGAYPIGSANSATGTLAAVLATTPTTRTWVGGSGVWDETTTNNWNPADVPHNGDAVNITSNSTSNLSIDYTTAILVGNGLAALTVGNGAGATNTLFLEGNDFLPAASLTLNAGGAIRQTGGSITNSGSSTISGGMLVQEAGSLNVNSSSGSGPLISGGGTWIMSNGTANTRGLSLGSPGPATFNLESGVVNDYWVTWVRENGTFIQNGGTYNQKANYMAVQGSNSVLNMKGGLLNTPQIIMNGDGPVTVSQSGGVITNASLEMREPGLMTVNVSGGAYYGSVHVGSYANSRALFNHTGGEVWVNTLNIGNAAGLSPCTYTLNGGILNVTLPNNANVKVYPWGTLQGYGRITMIGYQFQNEGRVIADGYGINTNLDLTMGGSIISATDNTTNRGWFAVNKGSLLLPPLTVTAGASSVNWGEAAADATPDLVNSARLTFTGASAGSLTGALYAADSAAIPEGLRKPAGVWSFGGVTCTTAVVTFRYDDAAAASNGVAEADLNIWRHNGVKWVNVTDTRDNTPKTITSQSIATWPKAPVFFAVAGSPRGAGALILIK